MSETWFLVPRNQFRRNFKEQQVSRNGAAKQAKCAKLRRNERNLRNFAEICFFRWKQGLISLKRSQFPPKMKPNFAINGAPFRPNHHFFVKFRCFRSFCRFRKLRWLHRKERNQVKLISHVRNWQFRGTFFAEKRLLRNFRSCLVKAKEGKFRKFWSSTWIKK